MVLRTDDFVAVSPLADRYTRVRDASMALCRTLLPEDYCVQAMPEVSPTKWHLAHTTWFFEQFILIPAVSDYQAFNEHYQRLFNSYYISQGEIHPRAERGLLTRPTIDEITAYRQHVDLHILNLIAEKPSDDLKQLVELGTHHEQQHQELMLTDIKYNFSRNPLKPALIDTQFVKREQSLAKILFLTQAGGMKHLGATGDSFVFDNETPRHDVFINDFGIADRLVTNREYTQFIKDGGYDTGTLWLSDGWAWRQKENIERPLYWADNNDRYFTLAGMRDIDPHAPVCHVSFYEADAYARWAGYRLPTEAEWEVASERAKVAGNFVENGLLHPQPLNADVAPAQLFGDVWEWTSSPYAPYPGFQPLKGSVGEYNGKFMINQMVCRGGSCVTPRDHIRATYRNFFYPKDRWQFFGIRLARNV